MEFPPPIYFDTLNKIMKSEILTFNFRRNKVISDFRNSDINTKLFSDFTICMLNAH